MGFKVLPPELENLKEWEAAFGALPGVPPFALTRFTVAPGSRTPPDSHAVTELWLVLAGRGTVRYEGVPQPVTAGDLLGFAPFAEHLAVADREEPLTVLSI